MYVIGSLAGGSYRPGRSDIDTLPVVKSSCTSSDENAVESLRKKVRSTYELKDFGAIVVREDKLVPPYDPTEELVPEILRLKRQGVLIRGTHDLTRVPDPTREDFIAYARVFYPWLRTLIDQRPQEYRTVDATVNTILYELRLLVWDRTGDYILDKREIIPAVFALGHSPLTCQALEKVQRYLLDGEPLSLEEAEQELQVVSKYVRAQVPWSVPPFNQ